MREITLKELNLLRENRLFNGFDDDSVANALKSFSAREKDYRKGEFVHFQNTKFNEFGFLLDGQLNVCTDDFDGNRMIMASVNPSETFGESLCFLKKTDPFVYVYAVKDSKVLWFSLDKISGEITDRFLFELQRRFTGILASRTLNMNSRIQILSKLSLREKIKTFFDFEKKKNGSNTFCISLNRDDMATYLGTNRTALSRELSKMKKDGIIDFYKNTFKIL